MAETSRERGVPLHTKILLGLALGATAGVTSNILWQDTRELEWIINNVMQPVGQVFLRLLFMVVIPLVFTTLALGVAGLGDVRKLGRVGGKTFGFFVFTTGFAATLGLILANVLRPGTRLDPATRDGLLAQFASEAAEKVSAGESAGFGINTFVEMVPRNIVQALADNQMLALIVFTIIFGIALTRIPADKAQPVLNILEGVAQAVIEIIGFAMKLAPYGVFGLIFAVTARFGFELLQSLALYVGMVLIGLAIHQFLFLPFLARVLGGVGYVEFFRRIRFMMVTAFSTSSSNATLPTTMRTAVEEFGVPPQMAGFVIPLGATMNMNGTALFEGLTVLFLAQVFGVDLSLPTQIIVVIMAIVTAIGASGVPSGSIPLLAMVLDMVGVPGEGIALILGVDRILDMCRTVPNVTGDLLTSVVVAKSEGYTLVPATAPDFSSEAALEVLERSEAQAEEEATRG